MTIFLLLLFIFLPTHEVLADTNNQVQEIMKGAENWHPSDYNKAGEQIKKLGIKAVPELIKLLDSKKETNTLSFLCDFLAEVPDLGSLSELQKKFSHSQWLVRSTCGQAYAIISVKFRSQSPDLRPLWPLVTKDPECIVRSNVAREISPYQDPDLFAYFKSHLFSGTNCERETSISGLSKSEIEKEWVGQSYLKIMTNEKEPQDLREKVTWALGELVYYPARPDIIKALEDGNNFGNFKTFLIVALGRIGHMEDIKILEKVIGQDPYHGEGVWTIKGKEAIWEIKKRQAH